VAEDLALSRGRVAVSEVNPPAPTDPGLTGQRSPSWAGAVPPSGVHDQAMTPSRSADPAFRAARASLSSSLWIGVALIWAATLGTGVGAVVLWGETAGWACSFFVVLLTPFAVGVLLMAFSDRRSWSVAARGVPVETRTGRGLGTSNAQGCQVVAYKDADEREGRGRPYLHLTLPRSAEHDEVRGPVSVEIFRRTGRAGRIGGPVRVRSHDGLREWWAGNAVESTDRYPEVTEVQTAAT